MSENFREVEDSENEENSDMSEAITGFVKQIGTMADLFLRGTAKKKKAVVNPPPQDARIGLGSNMAAGGGGLGGNFPRAYATGFRQEGIQSRSHHQQEDDIPARSDGMDVPDDVRAALEGENEGYINDDDNPLGCEEGYSADHFENLYSNYRARQSSSEYSNPMFTPRRREDYPSQSGNRFPYSDPRSFPMQGGGIPYSHQPNVYVTLDNQFGEGGTRRKQYAPKDVNSICHVLSEFRRINLNSHSRVYLRSMLTTSYSLELARLVPKYLNMKYEQCLASGSGILVLDDKSVEYLMKAYIVPVSREDFVLKLSSSLSFPNAPTDKSAKLSMADFEAKIGDFLEYNRQFRERLTLLTDLLTPAQLQRFVPEMNYKEEPKGLPRIYMEKIPYGQDKILLGQVTAGKKWSNFRNMDVFCEAVMRAIDKMLEDIRDLRIRCEAQGIIYPAPTTQSQYARSKPATFGNSPVRFEKRVEHYKPSSSPYRPNPQRLSNMDDDEVSYYEDGPVEEGVSYDDLPPQQGELQQREELELEADEFDDAITQLSAVSRDGAPQPCFKKMRMGTCPDGSNCKYSHDEAAIKQGILQAQAKLMSYPFFKNSGIKVNMPPDFRVSSAPRPVANTPQRSTGGYPQRRAPGVVNFVTSEEQTGVSDEAAR